MGIESIKLGTCRATFNNIDLGLTIGGVEVEITTETHETQVDQFGTSLVDETITGRRIMVRVPISETTLENLQKAIPGSTLITDSVTPSKKRLDVRHGVGTSLRASAQQLVLRPSANVPGNIAADDLIVPLAQVAGNVSFAYKVDEERVYMAEFRAFPNETTGLLFSVGDPTAVVV